jgi:SulP family sulfate permease
MKAELTIPELSFNPDLLKVLDRSPLGKTLGHDRMFFNLYKACEAYSAAAKGNDGLLSALGY